MVISDPLVENPNAVPELLGPPETVVPYKFPSLPSTSPACGAAPLVVLKANKEVNTPLGVNLKMVPALLLPPSRVVP